MPLENIPGRAQETGLSCELRLNLCGYEYGLVKDSHRYARRICRQRRVPVGTLMETEREAGHSKIVTCGKCYYSRILRMGRMQFYLLKREWHIKVSDRARRGAEAIDVPASFTDTAYISVPLLG